MTNGDAHPRRTQILAATAAGLLFLLTLHLLFSADWIDASLVAFAAAQLVAQLCEPTDTDPPGSGHLPGRTPTR